MDGVGRMATFALPLFLTHGRGPAEVTIDILAVLLLARSFVEKDWYWTRPIWVRIALLWWGWQLFCSIPVAFLGSGGAGALGEAVLSIRFMLMAAALQSWTLKDERSRRIMCALVCLCGGYIALQMLIQAAFGYNLFGMPRFVDGTLTGPYAQPRAAAPLSRLLLPMLMLGCAWIFAKAGPDHRLRGAMGAGVMTIAAVGVMVLGGQRMPFVLLLFGLLVCAALYRPVRPVAVMAALSVPLLVLMARVASPGSFRHLVLLAREQLSHFGHSPYGAIYTRALVMAKANPWTGLGYDAFRHQCANTAYLHGLSWFDDVPDGGGVNICAQHTHNHYLQALTNAGLPGLLLFSALVAAWLCALWPRVRSQDTPTGFAWRTGLFVAVLVQEWPIASTSDLMNLPLGGWAFMLLGVGLAEASPPLTRSGTSSGPT